MCFLLLNVLPKLFVYGINFILPVHKALGFHFFLIKKIAFLRLTRLVSAFLMNHPSPGGHKCCCPKRGRAEHTRKW